MESKNTKLTDKQIAQVILTTIVASILTFITITIIYWSKGNVSIKNTIDPEMVSSYGTILSGSIGTILTLVATILLYATYTSQKEELRQTNNIANDQANSLRLQNETIEIQRFENTFFKLLNTLTLSIEKSEDNVIYENLISLTKIQFSKRSDKLYGENLIKDRCRKINYVLNVIIKKSNEMHPLSLQKAKDVFNNLFNKEYFNFEKIFTNLLIILRIIDNLNYKFKFIYSEIVTAQISSELTNLLLYYSIQLDSQNELVRLLNSYNILGKANKPEWLDDITKLEEIFDSTIFDFYEKSVKHEIITKAIMFNNFNIKESERIITYVRFYGWTKSEKLELLSNKKEEFQNRLKLDVELATGEEYR